MFLGFLCVCVRKSWNLSRDKHTKCFRQEPYFENQRAWSHISQLSTLVALIAKLNDELNCLLAVFNLNTKQCRQYMQKSRQKNEATGSTHYHTTLSNKIGSNRTSFYIDGLIHSVVSAKSPSFSQFNNSGIQIHTIHYYFTEIYPVLPHWWVAYAILLLCWSTVCFFTLLSNSEFQYFSELYPIPKHCWGIPNIIALLRSTLTHYIAEIHQLLTHCWSIPYIRYFSNCGWSEIYFQRLSRNVVGSQSESEHVTH